MRLEDIPGIKGRKLVHVFVRDHLSMLFEDVRKLVVERGFNFACADLLCDLLSGLSVTVFQPAVTEIGAGKAFKDLVGSGFFPWDLGDTPKGREKKTKVLYQFIRNPLAHSLGVDEKPGYDIKIGKKHRPLTKRQLSDLERLATRPAKMKPVLDGAGTAWVLSVESLHHAVFRLFWNLAQDASQMDAAEKRFAAGQFAWRKP